MAKIVINNWHEGLVPQFWNDATLSKLGTDNMYAAGVVNPFIQLGLLSPTTSTVSSVSGGTAVISSSIFSRFALVDDENIVAGNTSVYVGNGAKIQAINLSTIAMVNAAEFPHTIAPTASTHGGHNSFQVMDIIPYQVNGVKKLWYFYVDGTDGDGGTYDLIDSFTTNSSQEEAWGTATGGAVFNKDFDIVAEVSDNGMMYVGNANNLYKFDGTSTGLSKGTVSSALTFDSGLQIVDMKDGNGYLWIALLRSFRSSLNLSGTTRTCFVLAWDRKTTNVSQTSSFLVNGVSFLSALSFFRGVPYIFVRGARGVAELRKFNGSIFETVAELGTSGYPNNPGNMAGRHNVYTSDRFIMWIGADKKAYLYGSVYPGLPDGLFQIGNFSGFSTLSSLTPTALSIFYIAGNNGTNNIISSWSPFATSGICDTGSYKSKIYELPKLSRIQSIMIYWPALSAGADAVMTLTTYINNSSSVSDSIQINYQNAPTGDGDRGFKYIPLGGKKYQNVNYFQIGLSWSAQSIETSIRPIRIEIEYEPAGQAEKKK